VNRLVRQTALGQKDSRETLQDEKQKFHGQSVTESIIDGKIEDQEKKGARSRKQGSEEQWHSAPAHGL
jgi:hypothetical protein